MAYLKLRKFREDDDGILQLELSASNGELATTQDFYVYPESFKDFGENLSSYFPEGGRGQVLFEYGSETKKYYSFIKIRFFYISLHTIGIQIRTNNKKEGYDSAVCEFHIKTRLQCVNNLGQCILGWLGDMSTPMEFNIENA